MAIRFIHTADWQLAKPFERVLDPEKRSLLRSARIQALRQIKVSLEKKSCSFIVVAGDLFDSPSPTNATISEACQVIGELSIPVYVIPGNHDYGGPGSLWERPFFLRERDVLCPNLHVLLEPQPFVTDSYVLLPCPLQRRHEPTDLTAWIRTFDFSTLPTDLPRILIAHGSVQSFGTVPDDDGVPELVGNNLLNIDLLPLHQLDYIALGDWHGTKSINTKTWYAGTPEPDRFARGDEYESGCVLHVTVHRALDPEIEKLRTGQMNWHLLQLRFISEDDLARLQTELDKLTQLRVNRDLLKLDLTGSLGLSAHRRLDELLESQQARLIRLDVQRNVQVSPTEEELQKLAVNNGDPLISAVASQLLSLAQQDGEDGEIARVALKELFLAI